jgi:ATP/maltotriose-dependent transcriptional regulator MalT
MAARTTTPVPPLQQARDAITRQAWTEAYALLNDADRAGHLANDDIERLATVASLIGRVDETPDLWTRAHNAWMGAGDARRAARCAFWLALDLLSRNEEARANGWVGRALRLLAERELEGAERGLLLVLAARIEVRHGNAAAAYERAREAFELSRRSGDAELHVFALLSMAQVLARRGEATAALALFDELMVAVTVGEVSPLAVGVAYCAVIDACQSRFDLARAREWTAALSRWCEAQPDLVLFRGQCIVHRAEVMRMSGAWPQAVTETAHACAWLRSAANRSQQSVARGELPAFNYPLGAVSYQLAELHRVLGDFAQAEDAYRQASAYGMGVEPGLALLRHAQGSLEAAVVAMRTALGQPQDQKKRPHVLAAAVEILLAAREVATARAAADELAATASAIGAPYLRALSRQAAGHVLLAEGNAGAALTALREAWMTWQEIEAPYEAARVRVLLALAFRELGDADAAELELDAATFVLEHLAAAPELARVRSLRRKPANDAATTLTRRELQVIALVATGVTNRAIARELGISERTVDRHVSNILLKLDLPSRAAATAYAYEHDLV